MISALTTNLTRFFREPHHFDHLKAHVLPPLIARLRKGGRVRLWSAGCSNGAEPYSIALCLLELMPEAADYDVRVLATDIDDRMIEYGRAGAYDAEQARSIPAALRDRWMGRHADKAGADWRAGPELQRLVAFRELNLVGAWPMRGRFDAIFCRNVVIYFDESTQAEMWSRFADRLEPGGRLYIGHSERVAGAAEQRFESDGVTTYRVAEGGR